jgi:hypothetical protein
MPKKGAAQQSRRLIANRQDERERTVDLIIHVNTFGRTQDAMKLAQEIKSHLQTGVDKRVEVDLIVGGNIVPVEDRQWRAVG